MTRHPRPAYYKGAPQTMAYSVRADRHRHTERRDGAPGAVVARDLHDHEADAGETRNLADVPVRAGAVAKTARRLDEFRPNADRAP